MQASAEAEVRARIRELGRVTFAKFAEIALYHPTTGYYCRVRAAGAPADYFTAPMAHPVFGALLAIQAERMWQLLGSPSRFHVVEMGAGTGGMARDLLDYAARLRPAFHRSLRYLALDRAPAPAAAHLGAPGAVRLRARGVPLRGIVGCFLSNELLDSFPAHRVQVQGGSLREVYVVEERGRLVEVLGDPSTPLLEERLSRLGFSLPEGYRGEVNLGIGPWIREVSGALQRGFVVTIDYGDEAMQLYSPRRSGGTLQTYYRHTGGASPYRRVGEQDITAHVDFSLVAAEGETLGLRRVALVTQADYLKQLGTGGMMERLRRALLTQRVLSENRMGMLELVRPEGMGGFKVLVQERGTGVGAKSELLPLRREGHEPSPEVPLLQAHHVPLMAGRYPHATWDLEHLWPPEAGPP